MFHTIPQSIMSRMQELEALDQRDRSDGTNRLERLRQIPPETGKFIALMLRSAPAGKVVEIGTSAGYSTLWLALVCMERGLTLTTYELLPEKVKLARETFAATQTSDLIDLVEGDARDHLETLDEIAFCFLDAEKEIYQDCYDLVVPGLCPGGILLADNAINHAPILQPMLDHALSDPRVDGMIVPVGKGILYCRKK